MAAPSPTADPLPIVIRTLGRQAYSESFEAMRAFTRSRDAGTPDELWVLEHDPVYTLGQGGRLEHVHGAGPIPVVHSDRGGQVTYHGPGQVVAYALIDLQRRRIRIREFVHALEAAAIAVLAELGLDGRRVAGAPGVYVPVRAAADLAAAAAAAAVGAVGADADAGRAGRVARSAGLAPTARPPRPAPDFRGLAKVAALGVKVSAGRTYHGLALNVDMDLAPFDAIDPCGYPGLRTLDLRSLGVIISLNEVSSRIAKHAAAQIRAASRV